MMASNARSNSLNVKNKNDINKNDNTDIILVK